MTTFKMPLTGWRAEPRGHFINDFNRPCKLNGYRQMGGKLLHREGNTA
jgi:hypothetical protein